MRAGKYLVLPLCYGVALACSQAGGVVSADRSNKAEVSSAAQPAGRSASSLPMLAPILKRVSPAVVNISAEATVEVQNPLLKNPEVRQFFHLPQDGKPMTQHVRSTGSGVIFDAGNGYILTNNHVINEADKILITLSDRRQFTAKLVAADEQTDVAVLKIDADHLTALPFGESKNLHVGDYVVAIGDPFGVGQAATFGIVSALGRSDLGIEGYEDFIQTDASINPGNSGGPLVDMTGKLVGINTAILSRSSGNVGVGFAIPVDMASAIADELLAHGKVARGEFGVVLQDLTPALARAFGIDATDGAVVSDVKAGSPAERGGIKPGDLITAVDGKSIATSGQLRNAIGSKPPAAPIRVSLIRQGMTIEVSEVLSQPDAEPVKIAENGTPVAAKGPPPGPLAGMALTSIPVDSKLHGKVEGVYIAGIESGSGAEEAGLKQGDVILSVADKPVTNPDELNQIVQSAQLGPINKPLLLRVQRGGEARYVAIG
jgi:Do/DeqQ family serine protease